MSHYFNIDAKSSTSGAFYVEQVTPGSCDRSFGIHVARIANFPTHVVTEAEGLANALERGASLYSQLAESDRERNSGEAEARRARSPSIEIEAPSLSDAPVSGISKSPVKQAGDERELSSTNKRKSVDEKDDARDILEGVILRKKSR